MTTQVKWNKLPQLKCLQRIELFSLKMVLFALIFGAMPCSFAQDKVSDYPVTDVENAAYTETKIAALEKKKIAVAKRYLFIRIESLLPMPLPQEMLKNHFWFY